MTRNLLLHRRNNRTKFDNHALYAGGGEDYSRRRHDDDKKIVVVDSSSSSPHDAIPLLPAAPVTSSAYCEDDTDKTKRLLLLDVASHGTTTTASMISSIYSSSSCCFGGSTGGGKRRRQERKICFTVSRQNKLVILFLLIPAGLILMNIYWIQRNIDSTISTTIHEDGAGAPLKNTNKIKYFHQTSNYRMTYSCEEAPIGDMASTVDSIKLFAGEVVHVNCSKNMIIGEHGTTRENFVLELVVAYCNADISWIGQDMLGTVFDDYHHSNITIRMTILSKCGRDLEDIPQDLREDHRVSQIDILQLENVGGCDYGYIYFINRLMQLRGYAMKDNRNSYSSTVVLFVKDTPRDMAHFGLGDKGTYRSFSDMIDLASKGEFACGSKTQCTLSPYHDVAMLNNWTMHNYIRISSRAERDSATLSHGTHHNIITTTSQDEDSLFNINHYRNLHDFHTRALKWEYPNNELTLVCYGGTFAVKMSHLIKILSDPKMQNTFSLIEAALARSSEPTIEEHFMERTWAAMLSIPLSYDNTNALKVLQGNTPPVNISTSIYGAIASGNIEKTCNKTDLVKVRRKGIRRKMALKKLQRIPITTVKLLTPEQMLRRRRNRKISSEQLRNYRKNRLARLAHERLMKEHST